MVGSELHTGDHLRVGESLQSPDGKTVLAMLDVPPFGTVLNLKVDGRDVWGAGILQQPKDLVMQADGNLVLYDGQGKAVWASGTNHHDGASMRLAVQDDNNVVIYMDNYYIWATETTRVTPFRVCVYDNADIPVFYPMIKDWNGIVWNGRWNSGMYWSVGKGNSTRVDFGTDLDQNGAKLKDRVSGRGMKMGVDPDIASNVWYTDRTFVYDDNCTDVWVFKKDNGSISWYKHQPQQ